MRKPSSRPVLLSAYVAVIFAGACRSPEIAAGVTDSTYVAAMADIKAAQDTLTRPDQFTAAGRAVVLKRHGVTIAQIDSATRSLARDPTRASEIWRKVELRASAPRARSPK